MDSIARHGRPLRLLVLVGLVCGGVGAAALPAAASAAGRRVVVAPKPGQLLGAGPVNVWVRAGKRTLVRARLNGRAVRERFSPARHGIRRLKVSPSHGLRFGRNVLRVRIKRRGHRRVEVHAVRFAVSAERPLAAAGHDLTVTVPGTVPLDASESLRRPHPRASRGTGRGLRYRWRVKRAPRASRLARGHRARFASAVPLLASAADLGVDDSDSSATTLTPDQPGTYDVELAVSEPDGTTGLDEVSVTLANPPLVDVDTMARFVPPTRTPPPTGPPPTTSTATTTTSTTPTDTTSTSTTPTDTTSTTTTPTDTTSTSTTPTDTTSTTTTTTDTTSTPTTSTPDQGTPTLGAAAGGCELSSTATDITAGTPGVKLGDQFCPGDATKWLQVVVLKRSTLEPVSNTNYDCRAATAHPSPLDLSPVQSCINQVQGDLGKLDSSYLVIASSQRPPVPGPPTYNDAWSTQPSVGVAEALKGIGVATPQWRNTGNSGFNNLLLRGRISAIGVPTYGPGTATVHVEPDLKDYRYDGDLAGHLIIDNNGTYTYLAPRVTFDTQAQGSNDTQNVVRVGNQTYQTSLALDGNQNGAGGFQVVVLDRVGLSAQTYWFPTGEQDYDSGEPGRLTSMASTLQQANATGRDLVIITSRGNPATQGGREDQQQNVNNAAKGLVDQIEALGGTRTAAFQALSSPPAAKSGASYTLIGWSGAGTAHGIESQGQGATPARGLNTAALTGTLARGDDYGFKVADTTPSVMPPPQHAAGEKLNETLVQPPQPWPDQGKPNQRAAIAYIGQKAFAGDDIRTDYWTGGKSDTWWQQKFQDVGAVMWAGGKGFTPPQFGDAQKEIKQEITWLLAVRDFTSGLASPFAKGVLEKWADLESIAANVNSDVQAPSQNKGVAIATAIFNGAREAASAIPVIGEGIGVVNQVYDVALEISKITSEGDEPADEPFAVSAANVGTALAARLSTAQNTLTTQMTNAIVADYGKLKTVGACDLLDRVNCPDDPQTWKFDAADQLSAAKALRVGTQVEDYAALTPARWTLWQLGSTCSGSTNYTCWESNFLGNAFRAQIYTGFYVCPFLTEPPSAKLIRPAYRDIPTYLNNAGFQGGNTHPTDIWQAYALGTLSGGTGVANNPYTMELPKDFLARLFAPLDPGGDIGRGGLGAQPEQFFLGNFTPKLMTRAADGGQPYPYNDSFPLWGGKDDNCQHD